MSGFWKNFKISFSVHVGIFIFLTIWAFFFSGPKISLKPSIRVDLVGLPDYTKKELSQRVDDQISELSRKLKSGKLNVPTPPKSNDDEMTVSDNAHQSARSKKPVERENPKQSALQRAIDRIKAIQSIEETVAKPKGNILSQGNQLTGETSAVTQDSYATHLQGKLKANWNLPVWLARQKLSAVAQVVLDEKGNLTGLRMKKKSENPQFDEYVIKTIKLSQPFGPPPKEWVGAPVELGFPL